MTEIHDKCDIQFERQVNETVWNAIMGAYREGDIYAENGTFAIRGYSWAENDPEDEDLNAWHFWHKPSGFKLQWYKYPLRSPYVNMDLTHEEFYAVLQDSMNSVRNFKDRTYKSWWEEFGRETLKEPEESEEENIFESMKNDIVGFCEELGANETLLFENPGYETAFMGIDSSYHAIYDYNKMIEYLMVFDEMTEEEAVEFIEYNTIRALDYIGDMAPIVLMYKYENGEDF